MTIKLYQPQWRKRLDDDDDKDAANVGNEARSSGAFLSSPITPSTDRSFSRRPVGQSVGRCCLAAPVESTTMESCGRMTHLLTLIIDLTWPRFVIPLSLSAPQVPIKARRDSGWHQTPTIIIWSWYLHISSFWVKKKKQEKKTDYFFSFSHSSLTALSLTILFCDRSFLWSLQPNIISFIIKIEYDIKQEDFVDIDCCAASVVCHAHAFSYHRGDMGICFDPIAS